LQYGKYWLGLSLGLLLLACPLTLFGQSTDRHKNLLFVVDENAELAAILQDFCALATLAAHTVVAIDSTHHLDFRGF
jgi:hypothetical protein